VAGRPFSLLDGRVTAREAAASFLDENSFSILCEIEPPRRPELSHVHQQIRVLGPAADAFLIPDNHLGRATMSSVAVAHEVIEMGGRSIAAINARDRNLLGFRRDLLTAAAYGVDHFLCVYGDPPQVGRRAEDVTVRGMIDEIHHYGRGPLFEGFSPFRVGTVARIGQPLRWKVRADFLFVQITYALDRLVRWRRSLRYDGRVYAGVLVLAGSRMARRVNATLPDVRVPQPVIDKLDGDPELGVELACEQIDALRASGAFDGVHLIPVGRYREVAARLTGAR
jgi:methylenetetrahydrofolate reductase (NADPH)